MEHAVDIATHRPARGANVATGLDPGPYRAGEVLVGPGDNQPWSRDTLRSLPTRLLSAVSDRECNCSPPPGRWIDGGNPADRILPPPGSPQAEEYLGR